VKASLIVIGPLPPPYHGVTISTSLVLGNRHLHELFDLRHVDTSDARSGRNIGRWDARNVRLAIQACGALRRCLYGRPGVVYLPLSQGLPGFLRDSMLIHLAASYGWSVAVHLRGSEFRSFYEATTPLGRRWITLTLRRVTSVAVMGESLRWVVDGLVPEEQIKVVPNGTPVPTVNASNRDSETILFLSNLRRRKGVVEAVEAAHLVTQKHASARFLFVGEWEDEDLERELRLRASEADGRIEFRTPVMGAEKEQLLSSASMMLFPPSEPEGHPRVVLEALAAGLPIIATNRGAIAETIVDGESGFVLSEPHPRQLADRIARLLGDSELRQRMAVAARERHLTHFTQASADRRLANWLRSVAP
jgi:glycosyltransferase involved in cell wall biosynthesis